MLRRRKGFTLIELLVVIAIIGILAAMLFPVFARARESARKIQCLSNVKNIALAYQMYLADYDRFPPGEHRAEVDNYFKNIKSCCCTDRIAKANPYLEIPVILDEYIKNRDVWQCPSARFTYGITINSGYVNNEKVDDWFREMVDNKDKCPTVRSCSHPFPPGWGGSVTDTILQGECPSTGGPGVFNMSIGVSDTTFDLSTSAINDPAKRVVAADCGINAGGFDRTSWIAYPDDCRIDSDLCNTSCGADWVNCSWTRDCAPEAISHGGTGQVSKDVNYRKTFLKSRHLGGSNIGFADGHAAWMASEAILFGGENWSGFADGSNALEGVGVCFNPTNAKHP